MILSSRWRHSSGYNVLPWLGMVKYSTFPLSILNSSLIVKPHSDYAKEQVLISLRTHFRRTAVSVEITLIRGKECTDNCDKMAVFIWLVAP